LSPLDAARADPQPSRLLLRVLILCSPLGFLALEAGWVVTEAGRQPWVIYGILHTADAVTPRQDILGSLVMFTGLYIGLLATLVVS
jgi:cytochrome d ubiquinol oxidase subunit I